MELIELRCLGEIRACVKSMIDDISLQCSLTDGKEFIIKLAANELLANGLKYSGNEVVMMYKLRGDMLVLAVVDKGNGFNWKCNINSAPDILSNTGRGIFLVESFSDTFRHNKKGNIAVIEIRMV